ncbi:hypothetical protein GCM10007426_22690 [Alloalcanivorax dieselolei]|nr:hypothetical protein GCM10007426_22690 [Alloalcanivorax dieselolei]
MGMGGTDNGCMQGAGRRRQIVGVAAQPSQQSGVFKAELSLTQVATFDSRTGLMRAHPRTFVLLFDFYSLG